MVRTQSAALVIGRIAVIQYAENGNINYARLQIRKILRVYIRLYSLLTGIKAGLRRKDFFIYRRKKIN
jgi:hypothetical protein